MPPKYVIIFTFQDYYGQQLYWAGKGEKGQGKQSQTSCSQQRGLKKHVKAPSSPQGALTELWHKLQDLPLGDNAMEAICDGQRTAVKCHRQQPAPLDAPL